ncbi:hypothetical protein [Chelatococcus asaccharovorans]|uniref:Uncharacterized protein n=1 Tax=Chelatococcus asaccharovorans TaxID=28210 RepID=A0A2V3UAR9_9HYPH|nr:hypothetical protein [Chelatococcus asaccharovorans]MBS7703190.1 hypothetical protein [Chelatococcus asaccharovorans]PXW61519.1 hypothetical protein C7450_10334 [Chelatococcus asaccharovorans]
MQLDTILKIEFSVPYAGGEARFEATRLGPAGNLPLLAFLDPWHDTSPAVSNIRAACKIYSGLRDYGDVAHIRSLAEADRLLDLIFRPALDLMGRV